MDLKFYFVFLMGALHILIVANESDFLQNNIQRPNWFESKLSAKNIFRRTPAGDVLDDNSHRRQRKDSMSPLKEKSLIRDVLVSYYLAQLERMSDFPTAFTTANISERCKQDSLNYFNAYKSFQLWALQSKQNKIPSFNTTILSVNESIIYV